VKCNDFLTFDPLTFNICSTSDITWPKVSASRNDNLQLFLQLRHTMTLTFDRLNVCSIVSHMVKLSIRNMNKI